MNDELAAVKKSYEQKAEQPTEARRARLASVQSWCEGRRNTLTSASKMAKFSMGEVSMEKTPSKGLGTRKGCGDTSASDGRVGEILAPQSRN